MYVLSAVRTPIALLNGSLCEFSAAHLCAIGFREALERAVVPVGDIENLFMGCALDYNFEKEITKRITLSKSTKIFTSKCYLECFVKACKFIHQYNKKVCLTIGVESMSNNNLFNEQNSLQAVTKTPSKNNFEEIFFNCIINGAIPDQIQAQSYKNNITALKNNALYDEILKINFKKKGHEIVVAEDEQIKSNNVPQNIENISKTLLFPGDGAAASLIASEEYIKVNQLTPLAQVISFASESVNSDECFSVMAQTIRKALNSVGFNSQSISMWEINVLNQSKIFSIISNQLNINPSLINKDGGIFGLGFPVGMYGGKMIAHIIHSLSPGQFGCAASLSINGTASAVILKKLCTNTSTKPQLTLYTKEPCSLCDDLEKQLEPYKNRFSLQKIDIELDKNKKFKNLYRYEIPVLFLDGTFLCKHKLDSEHFNRRLRQSEEIRLNGD